MRIKSWHTHASFLQSFLPNFWIYFQPLARIDHKISLKLHAPIHLTKIRNSYTMITPTTKRQYTNLLVSHFIFCLFFLATLPSSAQEEAYPAIDAFVSVEQEPAPVNMDEIKKLVGYPREAAEAGIQGQVVARVLVGKDGKYISHKIVNQVHSSLADAVGKHIPKLKFTPAIHEGRPIVFWVNIPFNFKILGQAIINHETAFEHFQQEDFKNATKYYDTLIKADKRDIVAMTMRGACRFYQSHPWAITDFNKALKLAQKLKRKNPAAISALTYPMSEPVSILDKIYGQTSDPDLINILNELIGIFK